MPTGGSRLVERHGADEIKVIGLRRKIAERMQDAKRRIPHFMYAEEIDVTELEDLRAHMNATNKGRADRPKLPLLPFLMRAMAKVLPDYPQLNARYDDEANVRASPPCDPCRHRDPDPGRAGGAGGAPRRSP